MSFSDEQAELCRPGADAHRVLSPADLVDLKYAANRARLALAELPGAIHEADCTAAYDLVGRLSSDLHAMVRHLDLDSVDDDNDESGSTSVLERVTRNGGRANDPQAMDASGWEGPGHDD